MLPVIIGLEQACRMHAVCTAGAALPYGFMNTVFQENGKAGEGISYERDLLVNIYLAVFV